MYCVAMKKLLPLFLLIFAVTAAADRLGHSSVNLTLDVYSHVLPHIQDNATEKIANIMRKRK